MPTWAVWEPWAQWAVCSLGCLGCGWSRVEPSPRLPHTQAQVWWLLLASQQRTLTRTMCCRHVVCAPGLRLWWLGSESECRQRDMEAVTFSNPASGRTVQCHFCCMKRHPETNPHQKKGKYIPLLDGKECSRLCSHILKLPPHLHPLSPREPPVFWTEFA